MAKNWSVTKPAFAEIYHQATYLGRSYVLADTHELAFATEQKEATRKAVKTLSRVAIKEAIATTLEVKYENELLGDLVRIILIGLLEAPDVRRWETLPRWLQVARVPCPADMTQYRVVYKDAWGQTVHTTPVNSPITKHRNKYISFCRDLGTR